MAFANTYLRISIANYGILPCPQSFLDKRGPVYLPAVGDDDPVEMTSATAGIKAAYETKYPNMCRNIADVDGVIDWEATVEDATHVILTLPNLSQHEIRDILGSADAIRDLLGAADAMDFDTTPVILALDEVLAYKTSGVLPSY